MLSLSGGNDDTIIVLQWTFLLGMLSLFLVYGEILEEMTECTGDREEAGGQHAHFLESSLSLSLSLSDISSQLF